jgi:LysM repeat protein
MKYYARMSMVLVCAAAGVLASCGSDDSAANDTLPPIVTTTTTTTLPPTTTTIPENYEIQSGDSLFSIAEKFGLTFAELAAYNGITNPDDIQAGQVLRIPKPGETTTSVAAAEGAPSTTVAAP